MKQSNRRYAVMFFSLTALLFSGCATLDNQKKGETVQGQYDAPNRTKAIDKSLVQAVEMLQRLRTECSILEKNNEHVKKEISDSSEVILKEILRLIQDCQELVEGENKRIRDMLTTDTFGGELGKEK